MWLAHPSVELEELLYMQCLCQKRWTSLMDRWSRQQALIRNCREMASRALYARVVLMGPNLLNMVDAFLFISEKQLEDMLE